MQQRFQPRALASWTASVLVHGVLLVGLSLAFEGGQGGRVTVLDVRIVPEQGQGRAQRAAKETARQVPRPKSDAASREAPQVVAGDPARRVSYIQGLRAAIEGVKTYPQFARARRQEGRVEVAFTLRKDGVITDVAIARSSSFQALDEEGTNTLGRLGRFRPIPDEVSRTDLRLVLPLEFQLQD